MDISLYNINDYISLPDLISMSLSRLGRARMQLPLTLILLVIVAGVGNACFRMIFSKNACNPT